MAGIWTLSELSAEVAGVLGDGSAGQASGRVRDVPDARTIRWYTTIGLVDRPAAMRGRTALYGRRHMLQLVAIKRLQSQGLSLAEVQQRLLGATDPELAQAGHVPAGSGSPTQQRHRFWAADAAARPAPATSVTAGSAAAGTAAAPAGQPGPVYGIALADGVTLLLGSRQPEQASLAEIAAAAQPLLDTLRRLQLAGPSGKGSS